MAGLPRPGEGLTADGVTHAAIQGDSPALRHVGPEGSSVRPAHPWPSRGRGDAVAPLLSRTRSCPAARGGAQEAAMGNAELQGVAGAPLDLLVSEARVDGGPIMKRIMPRARGTAYPIKRRYSQDLRDLVGAGGRVNTALGGPLGLAVEVHLEVQARGLSFGGLLWVRRRRPTESRSERVVHGTEKFDPPASASASCSRGGRLGTPPRRTSPISSRRTRRSART